MGRKPSTITLSAEDRDRLEAQIRSRTSQAQIVNRARILLLKADGKSIDRSIVIGGDSSNVIRELIA